MRHLDGEELEIVKRMYAEAITEAKKATCQKSRRGVIFAKGGAIIGRGYNGPPEGYACVPGVCRQHCRQYSVHAEERALYSIMHAGLDARGCRGYHVKVVEGVGVPSSVPSCISCSKHMKDAGIAEFVLQTEHGYALYAIEEFHDATIANTFGDEFLVQVKVIAHEGSSCADRTPR